MVIEMVANTGRGTVYKFTRQVRRLAFRGGSRGESHLWQMNGKFVASYSSLMGQYDLRRVSINFALSPIRLKVSSCSAGPCPAGFKTV